MKKLMCLLILAVMVLGCATFMKQKHKEEQTFIGPPDEIPPQLIYKPKILYPAKALENRKEAIVWVNSLVDSSGKVIDVKIVKFIGEKGYGFEAAAKHAAYCYIWEPAISKGEAISKEIIFKISYTLK